MNDQTELQLSLDPDDLKRFAVEVAAKYGVDPLRLLARTEIESGWNPFAAAKGSSALGLSQFIDSTARQYPHIFPNIFPKGHPLREVADSRLDPYASLEAQAAHIADLKSQTGGDEYQADMRYYGHPDPRKNIEYANKVTAKAESLASAQEELKKLFGGPKTGFVPLNLQAQDMSSLEPAPESGFLDYFKASAKDVLARQGLFATSLLEALKTGEGLSPEKKREVYENLTDILGRPSLTPPTSVSGKVAAALGGLLPQLGELGLMSAGLGLSGALPQVTGMASRMMGTTLPFLAQAATAPEPDKAMAQAGLLGGALGLVPPYWGRLARGLAGGGLFGGVSALEGSDLTDALIHGGLGGFLSALHPTAPRAGQPLPVPGAAPGPAEAPPVSAPFPRLLPAPEAIAGPGFTMSPRPRVVPTPLGPFLPERPAVPLLESPPEARGPGFTMSPAPAIVPMPVARSLPERPKTPLLESPSEIKGPGFSMQRPAQVTPDEVIAPEIDVSRKAGPKPKTITLQEEEPGVYSLRTGMGLNDLKLFWQNLAGLGKTLKEKLQAGPVEGKTRPEVEWIDNRDMGILSRFYQIPSWLAREHPDYQIPHIDALRLELRADYANRWLKALRPLLELPRESREMAEKLIVEADRLGSRWLEGVPREVIDRQIEALLSQAPPEVAEGVRAWHRVAEEIWSKRLEKLKEVEPETDLETLRKEMGYVPYYFPHVRRGSWWVAAYDEKGNVLERRGATIFNKNQVARELAQKYPKAKIKGGKVIETPEEIFFGLDENHALQLAKAALARAGKLDPVVEKRLLEEMANSLKARGFSRHAIKRRNIPGYEETDALDTILDYVHGAAGHLSKMEYAPEYFRALGQIDAHRKPRLHSYAEDHVRWSLRNDSHIDRAVGKLKSALFHYYLSFVPKSAVLNLTQTITTSVPWLSQFTVRPGIKLFRAMKDLVADGKAFVQFIRGKESAVFQHLTPEENLALRRAFERGIISDQLTREIMEAKLGRFGSLTRKIGDAGQYLFGLAEMLNRANMFLAAFRVARNGDFKPRANLRAMPFEQALEWAAEQVKASQFEYGRLNLPTWARNPLGRTIYSFRTFSHNYALMMRHLAKNDPQAFGRALANMGLLGGVLSVPLVREAYHAYKNVTGNDPLVENLQDKDRSLLYKLGRFGLPGLLDVDFSGSVAVEFIRDLSTAGDIPKEFLGAVGGLLFDSLPKAVDFMKRDDWYRAVESAAPAALRNLMSAYRLASEGQTTKRGQEMLDPYTGHQLRLSDREAFMKALGFQPARATTTRELQDYINDKITEHRELTDLYATSLVNAYRRGDLKAIQSTLKALEEHNREALAKGRPPIVPDEAVARRMVIKTVPPKWQPFLQSLR